MKFTKWDHKSPLTLEGFEVEPTIVDGVIRTVTLLRDGQFVIRFDSDSIYSSIGILLPAPPKFVDKFKLSGTVLGLAVEELFDNEYAAKSKRDEYLLKVAESDVKLDVSEVKVPE